MAVMVAEIVRCLAQVPAVPTKIPPNFHDVRAITQDVTRLS